MRRRQKNGKRTEGPSTAQHPPASSFDTSRQLVMGAQGGNCQCSRSVEQTDRHTDRQRDRQGHSTPLCMRVRRDSPAGSRARVVASPWWGCAAHPPPAAAPRARRARSLGSRRRRARPRPRGRAAGPREQTAVLRPPAPCGSPAPRLSCSLRSGTPCRHTHMGQRSGDGTRRAHEEQRPGGGRGVGQTSSMTHKRAPTTPACWAWGHGNGTLPENRPMWTERQ
jgi:hypothetical protein